MTNIERVLFITSVDRQKYGISRCENFEVKFNPPLNLSPKMKHELAIDKVSMTYSWHNISPEYANDTIQYSHDNGQTWSTVSFPRGMYSYDDSNAYLHEIMKVKKHEVENINLRFILTTYKA